MTEGVYLSTSYMEPQKEYNTTPVAYRAIDSPGDLFKDMVSWSKNSCRFVCVHLVWVSYARVYVHEHIIKLDPKRDINTNQKYFYIIFLTDVENSSPHFHY